VDGSVRSAFGFSGPLSRAAGSETKRWCSADAAGRPSSLSGELRGGRCCPGSVRRGGGPCSLRSRALGAMRQKKQTTSCKFAFVLTDKVLCGWPRPTARLRRSRRGEWYRRLKSGGRLGLPA